MLFALAFGGLWLGAHAADDMPPSVRAALRGASLPASALAVWVQPVDAPDPRLALNAREPLNPASVFKLVTTYAALDLLGPAYTWRTPALAGGPLQGGVLKGPLVLRGTGDPTLVPERLWLWLRRVQALGVRDVAGDIVLDRSAFTLEPGSAADFDGDATRPYNVRPDALLLNYQAVTYTFTPDGGRKQAVVVAEPTLAGVRVDASVPLSAAPCGDWRTALQAQLDDPDRVRFAGSYPAACGERSWPTAYAAPERYAARLVAQMWRELGGTLRGEVRSAAAPAPDDAPLTWLADSESPPLAAVVRDINKFSNNVMAEQLFLTLGAQQRPLAEPATTTAQARETLRRWLASRLADGNGGVAGVVVDNGSGLSRTARLSAAQLGRLLMQAWASPVMPELMASLPVSGTDGTLRRSSAPLGRAHLKTGSLRDVAAVAGYVLADSGRRYVVVALVNHPQAGAARPAFDALVSWVARDAPAR